MSSTPPETRCGPVRRYDPAMISRLPGLSRPNAPGRGGGAGRWPGGASCTWVPWCVLVLSPSSYGRSPGAPGTPPVSGHRPGAAGFHRVGSADQPGAHAHRGRHGHQLYLSRYALEMVIRVLVLELIPLTAALFVAMRCTIPNGTQLALLRQFWPPGPPEPCGADPIRVELLPRAVAGGLPVSPWRR